MTVDGKTYELNSATEITITVTDKGGTEKTYRLLPLPKELVQEVTDVPDGFYTKLTMGATGKAYYYNPHFAKTALAAEAGKPEFVSIRTARQLNNLSAYYDKYADEKVLPKNAAFQQERDIDYGTYEWAAYGKSKTPVKEQAPIGQKEDTPFKHRYDGGSHIITGVSFASGKDGLAVGLFGFTEGTLENIVVTTEEPLEKAPTSKWAAMSSGKRCIQAYWPVKTAAQSKTAPFPAIGCPAAPTAAAPTTSAVWWASMRA